MAGTITTHLNTNYNRHNIAIVKYPARLNVEPIETVENGKILPLSEGFSANYEPPSVCFKTYRSLINCGFKELANKVITTRKRSFVTPNYVWNGVMKFGERTAKRRNFPSYDYALGYLRSQMKTSEKIPILCMNDAVKYIPRSTSPGLPWIQRLPGWKKGQVIDKYLPGIKGYWNRVGIGAPVEPIPDCAAFARSHISTPDKNKVQPVWAYPLSAACQEARFSSPLIKLLKEQKILEESAYGMEMMRGGMTWLNTQVMRARMYNPGCKFIILDYSAFDATVPAWFIRDVFKIIEEKFDFSVVQVGDLRYSTDPEVERRKFRKILNYFINTTIRNSDGRRFQKNHGIPSGSMFANIIRTMVNLVVICALSDAVFETTPMLKLVFGDDGFIIVRDTVIADVDAISDGALTVFGMVINKRKSYYTTRVTNIHFLGYFNNYGSPIKGSIDLVASMLYPQHLMDDWSYCISRALGCILAAAGSNMDVFLCGQAVWWHYASRFPQHLDKGIEFIRENPRSRRFLDQMGCGDLPLSHNFFFDISLGIPALSCPKLLQNINIVKPC